MCKEGEKMEMINQRINELLSELLGKLFSLNRIFDRAMSDLAVTHKATNSSKILHENMAHFFLKFADEISSYQQSRGMLTRYPATAEGNQTYENPLQFYEVALEEMMKFEDAVCDVIDICNVEKDWSTENFLKGIIKTWNPYLETISSIADACRNYGSDFKSQMQFDDEIEDYLTIPNLVGD